MSAPRSEPELLTLLEMVSPFWCSLNGGDGGAEAGGDAAAGCRPTTWSLAVLWLVDKEEKRRNAFSYCFMAKEKCSTLQRVIVVMKRWSVGNWASDDGG